MGKSYIINHCLNHHNLYLRDLIFRSYVTDCLKAICKAYDSPRYVDMINIKQGKEETRTPEEIIDHVFSSLKKVKKNERKCF